MNAYDVAATVVDPEMPMLTLADLGVLRSVDEHEGAVTVAITPTYSGCPAMATMRDDLMRVLFAAGYADVSVRVDLSEPWSTDWITDRGRAALAAAGIAPPTPAPSFAGAVPLTLTPRHQVLPCPRCAAPDTERISEFGPTACTSLHRCRACGEPFEHVKAI